MIVTEHKNYKTFSNDKEADKYSDLLQPILDEKPLIRFKSKVLIESFSDLLYTYYVKRLITYYSKSGGLQCVSGRARSFIDLYSLQKYYFENPLDLKDLYKIHFNIPRINEKQKETYITNNAFKSRLVQKGNSNPTIEDIKAEIDLYFIESAKYYCTGVKYNVFSSNSHPDLINGSYFKEAFKELNEKLKLKNNE